MSIKCQILTEDDKQKIHTDPLPDDVISNLKDIMRRSDEELKEYKKEMNHAR